ncbi:activity-regulated cytoskeleton-associated protein-like [Onychostoma macrolepis]|uniref:activity-regulated cytoskeleton-associated protein-like n=1 Tax=Onychostoma macrolepis TaxID=369639 RepID=UPI00272C958D|nr:activity-regulated cytoskeleton-associated protein-like [Onychostoma macrolepis]
MDGEEVVLSADFTSESFTTRRETMRELITTFSDLYIDSDGESERERAVDNDPENDSPFPPPPPLLEMNEEADHNPCSSVTSLNDRITAIESWMVNISQMVSEQVPFDEFDKQCKKLEDRMSYHVQCECERVKQQLEMLVKDLGRSMVDCLKRRDRQLEQKFQALRSPSSTPIVPETSPRTSDTYAPPSNMTYNLQSSHVSNQSNQSSVQYNPPVKLDFPSFSNTFDDDPILFIKQCEEYFAVRPLSDDEIFASLTAVLKGTAKDWWMAERRGVSNWKHFKERFLHSFLSEDYKDVAARKLLERKQGTKESFRDFAFQYRALCLRWRKDMSEREMVQAILRNCNPRLASLL